MQTDKPITVWLTTLLLVTVIAADLLQVGSASAGEPRLMGLHESNFTFNGTAANNFKEEVSSRELTAGRRMDLLATTLYGFDGSFPGPREDWIIRSGHTPLINWAISYTPSIESGLKDAVLTARARGLRDLATPVMLRFAPGMDSATYGANVTSESSFIKSWRRAHGKFAAQGASNVSWVWCPSAASWSNGTAMNWYPGGAFVDWVCADGLNDTSDWKTMDQMFLPFQSAALSTGKPLMIGAFGTTEGHTANAKTAWIANAFQSLNGSLGNVRAAVYEDIGPYALTTSPDALVRWKNGVVLPGLYTPPVVTLPSGPLVPGDGALLGTLRTHEFQPIEQLGWAAFELTSLRKMDLASTTYAWGSALPTWREPWHIQSGRVPMISWGAVDTALVNNGSQDLYIRATAVAVRNLGSPVLLRWFWEMDGTALAPLAGSPAGYKAAWRRIHNIFTQAGATNVEWVWAPNAFGFETGVAPAFYPGDDRVDWIGADGFNLFPMAGSGHMSFTQIFAPFYTWAMPHNKPLMVAATGSIEGAGFDDKARWIEDMAKANKVLFPGIRAINYVNIPLPLYTDPRIYHWELATSLQATLAWTKMASQGYYKHNP